MKDSVYVPKRYAHRDRLYYLSKMNWQDKLSSKRSQGPLCTNQPCGLNFRTHRHHYSCQCVNSKLVCRRTDHQAADVLQATFMQALCSCQAGKLNSFSKFKAKPEGLLNSNRN